MSARPIFSGFPTPLFGVLVLMLGLLAPVGVTAQNWVSRAPGEKSSTVLYERMPRAVNLDEFEARASTMPIFTNLAPETGLRLMVKVSECGDYLSHELLSEGDSILGDALDSLVRGLEFSPAILDGIPVDSWIEVELRLPIPQ